nr:MAG TPA: hypothetical protein [Caudoviricetes sp.]
MADYNNFVANTDYMQYLLTLYRMFGMESSDVSAIRILGINAFALTNTNDMILYKSNQAIKEANVLTATKLNSIYKHAREVGIDPVYSTPAVMKMCLVIPESSFLKYAKGSGDVRYYTLSKYNYVTVGNFIYSLDFDIEIRLETGVNNDKYLTAKYLMEGQINTISDLINPGILAVRVREEDGWYYNLYVDLKQYVREIKEKEFTHRDYGFYRVQSSVNTDEIAGMDVVYKTERLDATNPYKLLKKKMYFENSRGGEDSIFMHHDSVNSFTLIHKSQDGGFRPLVGDKLFVTLYVTKGSRGNFQYATNQGSSIRFIQREEKSLGINVILMNDNISTGGESFTKSIEVLRKEVIAKKSTRDSIVIENDLSVELNKSTHLNEYSVIKYRNDILKLFNIYTILKFQNYSSTFMVPTNTLNLPWNYKRDGEEINPGSQIYMLKPTCVATKDKYEGEIKEETALATLSPEYLKYRNPFIVSFDQARNIVRLYDPYIHEEFRTQYSLLNSKVPYSYLCNWVRIDKDDYNSELKVTLQVRDTLTRTRPKEKFFRVDPAHPDVPIDLSFMKVYFVLYNQKGQELYRERCKMDSYIDRVDSDDKYYEYSLTLIKDKTITKIQNDQILIDKPSTETQVWVDVENLKGAIEIEMPTKKDPISDLLESEPGIVNKFSFDCWLTKNRSKDHKIQHNVIDGSTIKMFHYPLVEYDFYKDHKTIFRDAIKSTYAIEKKLAKFQGEFSYSIKFANTYGYSKNYTIGLTNTELNNVMLNMNFIIEKKLGATVTEDQLNNTVWEFLDNIKFMKYDEFHISNLQKYIKDSYPNDIQFIQFKGINGQTEDKQLISMNISSITNTTVIEKLSLPLKYDPDAQRFGYKVKWDIR